jgi:type I restriction enzyme M protein
MKTEKSYKEISNFFWNECCSKTLRGNFRESEYGDIILPFVFIRRLDAILEKHFNQLQLLINKHKKDNLNLISIVKKEININFYNSSQFTIKSLLDDPRNINENFDYYINSFSDNIKDLINKFKITDDLKTIKEKNILRDFLEKIYLQDLSKENVSNEIMGLIYEELIRISSEAAPKKNGDHFTPRDVVNLLVSIIFDADKNELKESGIIRSIFDPCCGSGGMLTMSKKWINENINPNIKLRLSGQELEDKTFALAKADFLITGLEEDQIKNGSSLSNDQFAEDKFDYIITNPPFGEDWHDDVNFVMNEISKPNSRFVAVPSKGEGSLLFLQHLISKGHKHSRIGMVSNGSALLTGDAGSGESEIRKYILENDFLETIIRLPDDLFFRTNMPTYLWILSLKKKDIRKNKVQLIDAQNHFQLIKKIIGKKRKEISPDHIKNILATYKEFKETNISKILSNKDFGYKKIQIERSDTPLDKVVDKKKQININSRIFDFLSIDEDEEEYFEKNIKNFISNSWLDKNSTRIGFRITFEKYFTKYQSVRNIKQIKKDLEKLDTEYIKLVTKLEKIKDGNTINKINPESIDDVKKILPKNWRLIKNYFFLENSTSKSNLGDETLLSVSEEKGIIPRQQIKDDSEHISTAETLIGYKKVKKNNLVNNIMLMWKGGLGVSNYDGIVSPAYEVYNFKKYIPKFFHYLFKSELYKSEFRKKSRGIIDSRLRLYDDDFQSIPSIVPSEDDQIRIVKFLEEKEEIINQLIILEKKRVNLLKEYKSSLSEGAVTGIINI